MERYYICHRSGSGTFDDPYFSEMQKWMNVSHSIGATFNFVAHTHPFAVMKYDLRDEIHNTVTGSLNVFVIDEDLDQRVSQLPTRRRTQIENELTNRGYSGNTVVNRSSTIKDVLKFFIHNIQISEWSLAIHPQLDILKTRGQMSSNKLDNLDAQLNIRGVNPQRFNNSTTIEDVLQDLTSSLWDG